MCSRLILAALAASLVASAGLAQSGAPVTGQRGLVRLTIPPAEGTAPAARAAPSALKSPLPPPKATALAPAAAAGPAAAGLASGGLAAGVPLGLFAAGAAAAALAGGSTSSATTTTGR